MILNIFLFISLFLQINCDVYKAPTQDFSKCKVHYSRSESTYTKFYQITDKNQSNSSLVFDLHFAVLAPRDAHILLTPSAFIQKFDPVYEIVLGAGGNSYSDIRRLQKSATKNSKTTLNLLSALDFRSFWLHVSKDGLIEVGKEGSDLAFISWRDPDPLPIQLFSFCTWGGVEAKWYYDCLREDGTTSNSQEVEKPLTTNQKLKKYLFSNYDPYIRPVINADDLTVVHLGLKYHRIHLDEIESKLIIDGVMQLDWLDEKINWNAEDYDNIESINLFFRDIWLPDLVLYNSASGPEIDFKKLKSITVSSEGWVTWVTQIHIEAWCDASNLGHWPQDEHICEIQMGFTTQEDYIVLEAYTNNISLKQSFQSEWEVTNIESGIFLIPTPWRSSEDIFGSTFEIIFTLKRFSSFYTTVYFAPIIVVTVCILTSFWLNPIGSHRISLYCFQLVLLSVVLIKLGANIPAHPTKVPYLVLLYNYGFISTLIALIYTILLINFVYIKHTKPLPHFIYKLLDFNYIKWIVNFQNLKISDMYNKLIDDYSCKDVEMQEMWILLGVALDRIFFTVFSIISLVFLCKSY